MDKTFELPQLLAGFSSEIDMGALVRHDRYLSDLEGCFADNVQYEKVLSTANPLVYSTFAPALPSAEGDLNFAVAVLYAGRVGDEFFLTKGHLHAWRDAAEVYIGLGGEGVLLLEDEVTSESRIAALKKDSLVYVPGKTMHRTVNTRNAPLYYLGIYPATAGHDYAAIVKRNFKCRVISTDEGAKMIQKTPVE